MAARYCRDIDSPAAFLVIVYTSFGKSTVIIPSQSFQGWRTTWKEIKMGTPDCKENALNIEQFVWKSGFSVPLSA